MTREEVLKVFNSDGHPMHIKTSYVEANGAGQICISFLDDRINILQLAGNMCTAISYEAIKNIKIEPSIVPELDMVSIQLTCSAAISFMMKKEMREDNHDNT